MTAVSTVPVTVTPVRSDAALDALRVPWSNLVEADSRAGFFSTWEWNRAWWRHLRANRSLQVWTASQGNRVIGLLPLCLRPARTWRPPPGARLELLGSGIAGSDYLDVLSVPALRQDVAAAFAAVLAERDHPIEQPRVLPESLLATTVVAALCGRGWYAKQRIDSVCPSVSLSGFDWEGYLASRGRRHREGWRRKLRKLHHRHQVSFERADSEPERTRFLGELMRLHELRWSQRSTSSEAFCTPALRAFHDDVSRHVMKRGWLRLFLLCVDGQPAAALYGFVYRGVFSYFQSGFDPAFADRGVGTLILGLAIRSAVDEGCHTFDLLHGNERYKYHWADREQPVHRISVYPPGMRGTTLRAADWLASEVRARVRWRPHNWSVRPEVLQ